MNIQNEETQIEPMPTQVDAPPKLPWQTPHLEELSIEATAGIGDYDGNDIFGIPITTLS